MLPKKKYRYILIVILIIATILRTWSLNRADIVTDESIISFRALGYFDFLYTEFQQTPIQWFDSLPFWTKLSFHDHPPLVFALQFIFFKIFGDNIIGIRIPFALAGIASVYLLFLIGKLLYNEEIGLLAAFILSISSYHTWISRIGLQESIVIFLTLLSIYFFLKALYDEKYYLFWGIALGLAFLTKYTTFFILPVFIIFILIIKRRDIFNKKFHIGFLLSMLIFSPVIIYNLMLYKTRGHFDLQISYLLDQKTPWEVLPGKPTGRIYKRFIDIFKTLKQTFPLSTVILLTLSLVYFLLDCIKNKKKTHMLIIITLILLIIQFLIIGPAPRFVTLVTPFFSIIISYGIYNIKKYSLKPNFHYLLYFVLVLFFIFTLAYNINTNILKIPRYKMGIYWSFIRISDWGYNNLEKYINKELRGKKTQIRPKLSPKALENYTALKTNKRDKNKKLEYAPWLFIYDSNLNWTPTIWYFVRRLIYQGFSFNDSNGAKIIIEQKGLDFYREGGYEKFYFIKATPNTLLRKNNLSDSGEILKKYFLNHGKNIRIINIKDQYNNTAMIVYTFE